MVNWVSCRVCRLLLLVILGLIASPGLAPAQTLEDFGDAPDSYQTLQASGGASHVLDAGTPLFLGICVDSEADGQPAAAGSPATGDDLGAGTSALGACAGTDDEEGVVLSSLTQCEAATATVAASQAGLLDAWIDFDGNGAFDPAEQIASSVVMLAGANIVNFDVPCDATTAPTYSRFRASTAGGLAPGGDALDGEVEDHDVTISAAPVDFGDAPDSYQTLQASGGASHMLDAGTPLFLGTCVDSEADGQPTAAGNPATGDDLGAGTSALGACAGTDDEEGVVLSSLTQCEAATATVAASQAGLLDAWIDFDGNGAFDPAEQIASSVVMLAGANIVNFVVPCGATTAPTYSRFRASTAGGLAPGGDALDGEVEDHDVTISAAPVDFGDAPDSYQTLQASGGASHMLDAGTPLFLGTCVDSEADGQPAAAGNPATGDDLGAGTSALGACAGTDDEEGVVLSSLTQCEAATATVAASQAGLLDAWIDFDGNGAFDPAEQIASSVVMLAGANIVNFDVPCDATTAPTYSRFRASTAGGLAPGGDALDGEVEDHDLTIVGTPLLEVPTTSVWGLIFLALLIAMAAVRGLARSGEAMHSRRAEG